jgi:hypothetical protein
MKVKAVLNKFLTNKWLLKILCVISILNIIENNIETIIQNISKNQCISSTTGNNEIVIEGGIKMADTAKFAFNQIYNVNALNKCLMDQSNKVKTAEKLANSQDVLTKTDTTKANTATAKSSSAY